MNLQMSTSRLSTGLKINSAADDPAGLIISEEMKAQITGISTAIGNTQDAINMAKTADAAMSEVQTILTNMRALAVAAANSAVADSNALQADQTQINSSVKAINEISANTQFNTKKLLDGSSGAQASSIDSTDIANLYFSGTFNGATVQNGPITLTPVSSGTDATIALNQTAATPGSVVATAGTFTINGYTFSSSGTQTLQDIANEINAQSGTTGVSANIVPNGGNFSITLVQDHYGANYGITYSDGNAVLNTTPSATSVGTDAVVRVAATTSNGVASVLFTGGKYTGMDGLTLTDNYGNTITLTPAGNALGSPTQIGVVNQGGVLFQVGAFANEAVEYSMPNLYAQNLGTGVAPNQSLATINLTTQAGAQQAIQIIDAAITQLSQTRGQLGAFQSDYLQPTSDSLTAASANMSASESQIADVNMAQEITNFTKYQIIQQSGMAVLAQANQQPQQVLKLLQNL